MIREHSAVFRSINGRRYLSKSAAIKADCRKLMERHYPTERPNYGTECPSDRYTHTPGWHFSESEECERIFARLLRFAKFFHGKHRTQATATESGKAREVEG